jgi:hypothetical protein
MLIKMKNFEFNNGALQSFMRKISKESLALIDNIIEKYSPIQIGEDVETVTYNGTQTLRVTKIELYVIDSWGGPGERLSFVYQGIPLKKNGKPMKQRKPIQFSVFIKNNEKYWMPSYNRFLITEAKMYAK